MSKATRYEISDDHNNGGVDRRGFLQCMAWAGPGALCVMEGGILRSYSLSRIGDGQSAKDGRTKLHADHRYATGIPALC